MDSGYKKLNVYNLAYDLSLQVHKMSLTLPKYEMFEEGSQVRRSSKSVCANIVEGYALRKYKNEYLRYLYRSYGSSEETLFHLGVLADSGSLADHAQATALQDAYSRVNAMLFNLIRSIERNYDKPSFLKES